MLSLGLALSLSSGQGGGASSLFPQVQALFQEGAVAGGLFDVSQLDTLFSDRSATPEDAAEVDGVVGTRLDSSGNDWHLIAPSDAARAILRSADGVTYIEYDLTDDYYEFTPDQTFTARMWIGTRWGYYKTGFFEFESGVTHRFHAADDSKIVIIDDSELSVDDLALLESYMGGDEYFAIFRTNDTTLFNRADNVSNVNFTLSYIGDNGVTYDRDSSQAGETVDVGAQGLTAPIVVRFPFAMKNDLLDLRIGGNGYAGVLPDIETSGLTNFWFDTNQLVVGVPNLAASLGTIRAFSNRFTGGFLGSITASMTNFRIENNLLQEASVDEVLADLVAAGASNGTVNVGGTGNAAPSAAGDADAATLVSSGWTVTTN